MCTTITCYDIALSKPTLCGRRVCCDIRDQYALHDLRKVWVLLTHLRRIVLVELQHLDAYVGPDHAPPLLQLLYDILSCVNGNGKTHPVGTYGLEAC